LIKFFHKINSLPTPGTDSEKLIWNVLEAERPDIRSNLILARSVFLRFYLTNKLLQAITWEVSH